MARPSKFTPERAKTICDNLRNGCTRKAAVGAAHVDFVTFLNWLNRYSSFSTDVTRAEDEAEKRFAGVLALAASPHDVVETVTTTDANGVTKTVETRRREFDWRAAESWLKRRRRADWGDTLDIGKLTPEQAYNLLLVDEARNDPEEQKIRELNERDEREAVTEPQS